MGTTWWGRLRDLIIELPNNDTSSNSKWKLFAPCIHFSWIILDIRIAKSKQIPSIAISKQRKCFEFGRSNGNLKLQTITESKKCKIKWLCASKLMFWTNGKQYLWLVSYMTRKRQQAFDFGKARSAKRLTWAWNFTPSSLKRKSAWTNWSIAMKSLDWGLKLYWLSSRTSRYNTIRKSESCLLSSFMNTIARNQSSPFSSKFAKTESSNGRVDQLLRPSSTRSCLKSIGAAG